MHHAHATTHRDLLSLYTNLVLVVSSSNVSVWYRFRDVMTVTLHCVTA